jgi:hypothetical protein
VFLTCVCFQIYNLIPPLLPFAYGKKKIQHWKGENQVVWETWTVMMILSSLMIGD